MLGEGHLKRSSRSPTTMVNEWNGRGCESSPKMGALAALIYSSGLGLVQRGGSPDRWVKSLREGQANLACKLQHLLVHVRSWLSSWSSSHTVVGYDVVLLCWPWRHYSLDGGLLAALCNTVSIVAFIIVS